MLSNQAATNASAQFNATSTNQTNQFMASLANTVNQSNAQRDDAMSQFNTTEANRIAQINAGNELEADRLQEQLNAQIGNTGGGMPNMGGMPDLSQFGF